MTIITDLRCTGYESPGHPEAPWRVGECIERLRRQDCAQLSWGKPAVVTSVALRRAHSQEHLHSLALDQDHDEETPALPRMVEHARRATGGALAAMKSAWEGEKAFSLMRPPGHHATRDRAMGYCYLNPVAVAVLQAMAWQVKRIAVFDFDVHHGNGTEAILMDVPGCAVFSVHQFPGYPGSGEVSIGNSHNYPLAARVSRTVYRDTLAKALEEVSGFQPELLALSAGFDAFREDPVGEELLEVEDYLWLGELIGRLPMPVFGVLEGGYSRALPDLVQAFLEGWGGSSAPWVQAVKPAACEGPS